MKVLVKRGAGFIGSHVAGSLRAEGHEVALVVDLSDGRCQNVPEGAAFYELDVRSGCEEVLPSTAYVTQNAYRRMLILP